MDKLERLNELIRLDRDRKDLLEKFCEDGEVKEETVEWLLDATSDMENIGLDGGSSYGSAFIEVLNDIETTGWIDSIDMARLLAYYLIGTQKKEDERDFDYFDFCIYLVNELAHKLSNNKILEIGEIIFE